MKNKIVQCWSGVLRTLLRTVQVGGRPNPNPNLGRRFKKGYGIGYLYDLTRECTSKYPPPCVGRTILDYSAVI